MVHSKESLKKNKRKTFGKIVYYEQVGKTAYKVLCLAKMKLRIGFA